MAKKLTKASIERSRAAKARADFLKYQKRSQAAKKGWERIWREGPDKLFEQARSSLLRFRSSHALEDYARFKRAKKHLYAVFPEQAHKLLTQAAEAAEWTTSVAMKFAKLS